MGNIGKDVGQGANPQVDARGIDADLKAQQDAKYDFDAENEVAEWIDAVTGSSVKGNFAEGLKSGVVLCELLNKLKDGTIPSINESAQPFKQRENISNFLTGAQKLGVRNAQVFNPDDLFDAKSLGSVVACVYALGGACQSSCPDFAGPKLGIADASHTKVDKARAVGPATQTGGLHAAMEKSVIDTSKNIVLNTGGATTAGGMSRVVQGLSCVMQRSHIDKSKNIVQNTGRAATAGGMGQVTQGSTGVVERSHIDKSKNIVQCAGVATAACGMTQVTQGSPGVMERSLNDESKNIVQN